MKCTDVTLISLKVTKVSYLIENEICKNLQELFWVNLVTNLMTTSQQRQIRICSGGLS